MALVNPEFYSGPALIVGDGNFSFSACLARFSAEISTTVFATSLDTEEQLRANPFARENLAKISEVPQFTIIHGVDATNLDESFDDQQFHKIIFNFPHTGGKLKISKCRELLAKFFISASKQIEPTRGVVCVSLCQGQGGTPQDPVQRSYGNTWQVVEQASKAGLILNGVHPFHEADYPGYTSAGFKGRIHQKFTTKNGFTYLFVPGTPLYAILDIKTRKLAPKRHGKLFFTEKHPLGLVKKKVEHFFESLSPEKCYGKERFIVCKESDQEEEEDIQGINEKDEKGNAKFCSRLYQDVCQRLQEGCKAFALTGVESDYNVPPTAGFYPITHHTVIIQSYSIDIPSENIQADLKSTCQMLFNAVCPSATVTNEVLQAANNPKETLNFAKRHLNLFKPVDYQRLRERQRTIYDWKPKSYFLSKTQYPNGCCSHQENTAENNCRVCHLEKEFFSKKDRCRVTDLLDKSTILRWYCGDKILLTSGLLDNHVSPCSHYNRWVILAHLDYLTMTLCGISDIRMLWSSENLFLQQFADVEDEESLPQFQLFSLYPTVYIHDISFWLNQDSREETFFRVLHGTTVNCVSDVYFREEYVDNNKVSYNYRIIYSRCDGPLTHLQTVEMQNHLRKTLLEMKFDLS